MARNASPGLYLRFANVFQSVLAVFFVRSGSKPIEFEKGKNAIAVSSLDKISLVIDILITAVRNGELDDQLAQASRSLLRDPPTRKIKASDEDPRLWPLRTMREYRASAMVSKMKGPAMPGGMWGMTGLPANSFVKGGWGRAPGDTIKVYILRSLHVQVGSKK